MSSRWDETWHRLLEWTNGQAPSERLAAQILWDCGFTSLDPIHPLGGKDGGKDAICFKGGERWIMAVYFPRGQQELTTIRRKFTEDATGVTSNAAVGMAFVTNQELRQAERDELSASVPTIKVELFHLEKITAILDKPAMSGIRKQFLDIGDPLNGIVYAEAIPKTMNVIGQAEGMLRDLARGANRNIDPETIELQDIEQICKSIPPRAAAPLLRQINPPVYASWLELLCYWRDRSRQFAEEVLVFTPFLEPEHVALLARVEQCSYFKQLPMTVALPERNPDISWLASSIWDYVQRVRQLRMYVQKLTAKIGPVVV